MGNQILNCGDKTLIPSTKKMLGGMLICLAFLVSLFVMYSGVCIAEMDITPPAFIAHAGGEVDGLTYTNSLEALDFNYKRGFRGFEIDFCWTSDGELVAVHDWEGNFKKRFHISQKQEIPSLDEFLHLESKDRLTQLSLSQVLRWAKGKGDVFIVTDIKRENTRALEKIYREQKELVHFIVPQAYSYNEFRKIKKIGYNNVILTLYRIRQVSRFDLDIFCSKEKPFAVTMQYRKAFSGLADRVIGKNVFIYAHTVNDPELYVKLRESGVRGFYTDSLPPTMETPD